MTAIMPERSSSPPSTSSKSKFKESQNELGHEDAITRQSARLSQNHVRSEVWSGQGRIE